MHEPDLKATTIYLRPAVLKALRREALEQGVTMAELVRRVVEAHLREAGHRLPKQREAIRPGPRTKSRK